MPISDNKLKHIRTVAETCERIAKNMGLPEEKQRACYVMGFLHDIGYSRELDDMTMHGEAGAGMIADFLTFAPEILDAIKTHGKSYGRHAGFKQILNEADLTVSHDGRPVSAVQRLEGIREHHGENSEHYKHAKKQAEATFGKATQRGEYRLECRFNGEKERHIIGRSDDLSHIVLTACKMLRQMSPVSRNADKLDIMGPDCTRLWTGQPSGVVANTLVPLSEQECRAINDVILAHGQPVEKLPAQENTGTRFLPLTSGWMLRILFATHGIPLGEEAEAVREKLALCLEPFIWRKPAYAFYCYPNYVSLTPEETQKLFHALCATRCRLGTLMRIGRQAIYSSSVLIKPDDMEAIRHSLENLPEHADRPVFLEKFGQFLL